MPRNEMDIYVPTCLGKGLGIYSGKPEVNKERES